MNLIRKYLRFSLKDFTETGEFTGIASTYGSTDLGGDVIERGAFTKTLIEGGNERVLLWQHDPRAPIGLVDLEDSDGGLLVKRGRLELALEDSRRALTLIKSKIVRGLSIGYEALQWEWKKAEGEDGWPTRIVKEIKLWEVSIVTFPMNEEAVITNVKSAVDLANVTRALKEGRQLSAENRGRLQSILDGQTAILEQVRALLDSADAEKGAATQGHDEPSRAHSLWKYLSDATKGELTL